MTPLLDHTEIPSADLGALSRRRWAAELHFREVQTARELDMLRSKSREMMH